MLRIQSGELSNRPIETPPGRDTRPPLARVRKAVIDTLRPYFEGARTLDLFGGSGSYSFEAISNGAARATVIEISGAAVNVIHRNAQALGISDRIEVVRDDALSAIPRFRRSARVFDVIFVAPPQRKRMVEQSLATLREHPVFDGETVIVCQFERGEVGSLDAPPFTEWKRKVYGRTEVAWLQVSEGG